MHLAQAKNYVVAYNFPTGLLINFGATSLQYKKVFNPKYNKKSESGFTRLKDEQDEKNNKILKSPNPLNPD